MHIYTLFCCNPRAAHAYIDWRMGYVVANQTVYFKSFVLLRSCFAKDRVQKVSVLCKVVKRIMGNGGSRLFRNTFQILNNLKVRKEL